MMKLIRNTLPVLLLTAAVAAAGCPVSAAEEQTSPAAFYQQLSQLIREQDDSCFFGTIRLTLGSDQALVDGVVKQLEDCPQLRNDRTMLTVQSISQLLSVKAVYDPQNETVTLTSRWGEQIICPVDDKNTIIVKNTVLPVDAGAYTAGDQIFLPLRAVAEAFSMTVEWEGESGSILLAAPYQTARLMVVGSGMPDIVEYPDHTVLSDGNGLWILQFGTPGQAVKAEQMLLEQGITVQPDLYLPGEITPHE